MEIKEYCLGLLAIITGLAISDMVVSVHALLRRFGRTRWDWLPMTAAALVFVVIVRSWWIAWYTDWNNTPLWQFLLILIQLICMFLAAKAVLPDEGEALDLDMMDHYRASNRYVWGALIGMIVAFAAAAILNRLGSPQRLAEWFFEWGWELPLYCGPLVLLIAVQRMILHRLIVPTLLIAWLVLNGGSIMQ
jgi:hypothetical protein